MVKVSLAKPVMAVKTLAAIEQGLERAGVARFQAIAARFYEKVPAIKPHSKGLRVSSAGYTCNRRHWLDLHWFAAPFKPNTEQALRMFRGQREEPFLNALLVLAGGTHNEAPVLESGRVRGKPDALFIGLPDFEPNEPVLVEMKCMGVLGFKELAKSGVKMSHPEYYTQLQLYLAMSGNQRGLFFAINKNTDALHLEIIEHAPAFTSAKLEQLNAVAQLDIPPPVLKYGNTSKPPCSWCPHKKTCFDKEEPLKNCRTCQHVRQTTMGSFVCMKKTLRNELTYDEQLVGCSSYQRKQIDAE